MSYCFFNSDKCEVKGQKSGNVSTRLLSSEDFNRYSTIGLLHSPSCSFCLIPGIGNHLSQSCFEIEVEWLLQEMAKER